MEGKITGGALFTNSLEDTAKERENKSDERRVSFAKGEEDLRTETVIEGKEGRKKLYRIKSPLAFH